MPAHKPGRFIAVDFDGTCVDHCFPLVGRSLPGAVETLRDLHMAGHNLILWTMRSNKHLQDAVDWFLENKIFLYAKQGNPTQASWTTSPKCYAHIYIDDCSFGAPLIQLAWMKEPGIDWAAVRKALLDAPA